jgi:NAD+ kinase
MKKVGIIVKKGVPEAIGFVKKLIQWFDKKDVTFYIESGTASSLKIKGYSRSGILSKSDVVIVFGGDGTLLSVARIVGNKGIPILGVNLGSLGFIAEVSKDEIRKDIINYMFSDTCHFEERITLLADIYRKGKKIATNTALNDVVINKSAIARMIELNIHINNQYATKLRSDGLIVSTPTGSTAYSLSAGGPILYPTLESFVVTPICPHTLSNRPIVLPDDFTLEVQIKSGEDVYLTLDGQVGSPLKVHDKVRIRKGDYKTKFILLHDRDYFDILKSKLKWGK